MSRYRSDLPQLRGELFLADGGLETDLIFNHGVEIREFAAHTLLETEAGRRVVKRYFLEFLALAEAHEAGFILDSQTWKAHAHWAADLGTDAVGLRQANEASLRFIAGLRDEAANRRPVVLNAIVGPRGDAYAPGSTLAAREAEAYHAEQVRWLAETDVDMVTATTFTHSGEAAGFVRAARSVELPVAVSFTVETDGRLPSGEPLGEAIEAVDAATDEAPAYFVVNCAHPDHFSHVLDDAGWARRLRGLRCNASRKSHAELDASETLDAGNPVELAGQYVEIARRMPWLNIFGGCCGSDLRHVRAIAEALRGADGSSA